jgi:hypothetical protein
VAREHDGRLRYAAAAVPGLTILRYKVTFQLTAMPELATQADDWPGPSYEWYDTLRSLDPAARSPAATGDELRHDCLSG